ncbi:hypothetical protein [Caballeronia glathei]|uniref:Uncharacterized protein n=1 Tax=Caballeronia glathei TaxID=60547 RepID=A0A069PKD7_9BURK|nr:hypothetical protein [Caballeronia glathei]KDR40837.1 hypothetical protein BG61_22590 [Caballeronia glathei]
MKLLLDRPRDNVGRRSLHGRPLPAVLGALSIRIFHCGLRFLTVFRFGRSDYAITRLDAMAL